MSNYTLAVNWAGKNGLSDSNAAKVISGSDFNSEFTTVRTAINSKADLNGVATENFAADDVTVAGTLAVTGVPTIPTASAGTNTTQAASTAFVTAAVAALNAAAINAIVYPVGSIYFQVAVATNPNSLLGMGTWVAYGAGRVLVGKAASGTFDTLNETMGHETHTLTIAEMPSHAHTVGKQNTANNDTTGLGTGRSTMNDLLTGSQGSGNAHNNLQPSITVYMWKRTA